MKAIRFDRFGPPEVLGIVERPVPTPGPGEVLIGVRAAGVNFFEVLMRGDRYAVTPDLPMFPGVEIAGVVEGLGEGVESALLGTRVAVPLFATERAYGGYAEYVVADLRSAIRLPNALGFAEATALLVQGLTALHMVRQASPKARRVLITAAGGGVGSLLLQLAKREGAAVVIAAASTAEKRSLSLSLGAHHAVDYGELPVSSCGGVDLIYDTVGGDVTRTILESLAPGGELMFGALGRFQLDEADLNRMIANNQKLTGFALIPLLNAADLAADVAMLFDLAAQGVLKVQIGGRFALADVASAHRAIESRSVAGKVVLVPTA